MTHDHQDIDTLTVNNKRLSTQESNIIIWIIRLTSFNYFFLSVFLINMIWVYSGLEVSLGMCILGRNRPVHNHEQVNEGSMPEVRVLMRSRSIG